MCTDDGTCRCFSGFAGENCTESVLSSELICPDSLNIEPHPGKVRKNGKSIMKTQ